MIFTHWHITRARAWKFELSLLYLNFEFLHLRPVTVKWKSRLVSSVMRTIPIIRPLIYRFTILLCVCVRVVYIVSGIETEFEKYIELNNRRTKLIFFCIIYHVNIRRNTKISFVGN